MGDIEAKRHRLRRLYRLRWLHKVRDAEALWRQVGAIMERGDDVPDDLMAAAQEAAAEEAEAAARMAAMEGDG